MRNQKGVTLVELLAALVIIGFLTILIWRIFFQAVDSNSYAVTDQTLQQEANVILATLQSLHTRETIKEINTDAAGSYLEVTLQDDSTQKIATRSTITYRLYGTSPEMVNNSITTPTVLKIQSLNTGNNRITLPVHVSLTSNYTDDRTTQFILTTTLSKLTTQTSTQ